MEEEIIVPISGETEEEVKKPRKRLKILIGVFCLLFLVLTLLLIYQVRFARKADKPEEVIPEPGSTTEASPSASPQALTLTEELEKTEKEIKELDFDEETFNFPSLDMEIEF